MMRKQQLLFLIIFVEGYVVLATELLAIRGLIPFVGSGVEVVSILIGAVLLPLAVGYWAGGERIKKEHAEARQQRRERRSIRRMLGRNLLIALIILAAGLSYPLNFMFFATLYQSGIGNRIVLAALYAAVFLVFPIYLLAQTVPMVSNYFSRARLATITGRMLFFSTAGSFFGSIISTLVFMTVLGVHNTVIITICMIAGLVLLVSPRKDLYTKVWAIFIAVAVSVLNSNAAMKGIGVVADTPYSLIAMIPVKGEDARLLNINHSLSSKFTVDPEKRFPYIRYIDDQFITPLKGSAKRDILVLGAGGFVVGWDDRENNYTFVDIDGALKGVAEKYFLQQPLPANKRFVVNSARAYVHNSKEKYDLVVVDVFSNIMSIPMEAVTKEFLQDAKSLLKQDGILVANVISSPNFDDRFSLRYYNTFASVFPIFNREVIGEYSGWAGHQIASTMYVYFNKPQVNDDRSVYSDDRNTYSLDH